MKGEGPAARLRIVTRQNARPERVLRARSGVDGDAGGDELRVAADEILRHCGDSNDDIADGEHGGASEEIGQEAVDYLESLADKAGKRRKEAQRDQTEAELGHHHREYDGGDAVLQMVHNMATADQAEGHALLPQTGLECKSTGGGRRGGSDGGGWSIHDG